MEKRFVLPLFAPVIFLPSHLTWNFFFTYNAYSETCKRFDSSGVPSLADCYSWISSCWAICQFYSLLQMHHHIYCLLILLNIFSKAFIILNFVSPNFFLQVLIYMTESFSLGKIHEKNHCLHGIKSAL